MGRSALPPRLRPRIFVRTLKPASQRHKNLFRHGYLIEGSTSLLGVGEITVSNYGVARVSFFVRSVRAGPFPEVLWRIP